MGLATWLWIAFAAQTNMPNTPAETSEAAEILEDPSVQDAISGETSRGRTLAGHTFIPSDLVNPPFITTHVDSLTGGGFLKVSALIQGDGGQEVADFDLGAIAQTITTQFALTEFLAVGVAATGQAVAGVNNEAALVSGATLGYGLQFSALVRLLRVQKFVLSAAASGGLEKAARLSPIDAINQVLATGNARNITDLFVSSSANDLGADLRAALSLHPVFGLTANIGLGRESFNQAGQSNSEGVFSLGLALSLDFNAIRSAPVGFLLGYGNERSLEDGATPIGTFVGGIFYTGREDLALGLEAAIASQGQTGAGQDSYVFVYRMRYYW